MFMLRRVGVCVATCCSLSACATVSDYLRRPTKAENIPNFRYVKSMPPVATISLDASRRLVISQQLKGNSSDPRYTCPEPPPDVALSTLAQTAASLNTKAGNSAEASSAFVALARVLSARTSTVEFWRTTSSTYCVLLMNGETRKADRYLEAALVGLKVTKDTTVTSAAEPGWPTIDVNLDSGSPARDHPPTETPPAPPTSKPEPATPLAAAKTACKKVPVSQQPTNADCKKVLTTVLTQ